MEIVEVIKKLPKLTQIILSDSQIVFSGEKEFVTEDRLNVFADALVGAEECLQTLRREASNLRQQI